MHESFLIFKYVDGNVLCSYCPLAQQVLRFLPQLIVVKVQKLRNSQQDQIDILGCECTSFIEHENVLCIIEKTMILHSFDLSISKMYIDSLTAMCVCAAPNPEYIKVPRSHNSTLIPTICARHTNRTLNVH